MTIHFLATKLQVPPLPQSIVPRERLVRELERCVPASKLTLLAAPAGYGKTTLLQQWIDSTPMPIAWLSLNERDDEIERFLRYLYAAWETAHPNLEGTQLGLLIGGMAPDSEQVLAEFVNAANELAIHTALVLDDYHRITSPSIHEAVTFLLDHAPPRLRLVMSSRAEPPLPLARYRARQELHEIGAGSLSFIAEEAESLLGARVRSELSPDAVAAIQEQTEGWAAGLQLAALVLERNGSAPADIHIGGRNRFVADYLSEEVFGQLSEDVQRFMVQTSILESLNAQLCNAITGNADGQVMLESLERSSLFVVPLDEERRWFRYHPIFGDFLRAELERRAADEIGDLHRRAARWHLDHDRPEQALDHAVAGEDPEIAECIVERYLNFKLNTGEVALIGRWLNSIPSVWFASHPVIGLARVGFLAYTGAFQECIQCIEDVEQRVARDTSPGGDWQRAMVSAIQCFLACIQNDLPRAEMQAERAFQGLRPESLSLRSGIYGALGDTYRRNGHWQKAEASYLEALKFLNVPPFQAQFTVQAVHIYGALADLELGKGNLRAARDSWRKAIATIQDRVSWGRLELPLAGWIYIRMAEVLYEFNDLESAREHLSRGLERVELGGDVRSQVAGCLVAGRLELARDDIEAAAVHVQRAGSMLDDAPFPEWKGRYERLRLELWLAQDHLRAAVNWADSLTDDQLGETIPEREVAILALARVLIVKGDDVSIQRALDLLDHLIANAADAGRMVIEIEGLALQAIGYRARSEPVDAMRSLERALRLAEPEGFMRLFVDLGMPIARLLQEARSRGVFSEYVEELLAAFGQDAMQAESSNPALLEPLTDREQEILELIAAGLSNPEIADELFISPETVKKHAGSIYGKLDVHSRTEAASRARELDLLG